MSDRGRVVLAFAGVVPLACYAAVLAFCAGAPAPKAPPGRVTFAHLAGARWAMRYGLLEGEVCLRADQTYDAYLDTADGCRLHYRGQWWVTDGSLTLMETSDGGDTWDRYDCRLKPDAGWHKARACAGFMSREPVVPPGPRGDLEVGFGLRRPAAIPPDSPAAEPIRRFPNPGPR